MNAEFQWWLLLVGLVIGALLVFLVMVDFSRSADEQLDGELARESTWIAGLLRADGSAIEPAEVEEILRLNREWLAGPALRADELQAAEAGSGDLTAAAGDPADVEGYGPQG
jgi:hypothetical protein